MDRNYDKILYYVHCGSHGAPHPIEEGGTCWCGCIDDSPEGEHGRYATKLSARTLDDALEECRRTNLWLYCDTSKNWSRG